MATHLADRTKQVLLRTWLMVAIVVTLVASVVLPAREPAQKTRGGAKGPPLVSSVDAPAGTEKLDVQWIRIADADLGAMLAAVARPSGSGPHPRVVLLHGTHGFAHEYVQWARDLARCGFLAVAACCF